MQLQRIRPEKGETEARIRRHLSEAKDDQERREIALCWKGYIGALTEWSLISIHEGSILNAILPKTENNPVLQIMLGFPDED